MSPVTIVLILAFLFCLMANVGTLLSRRFKIKGLTAEDNETALRIIVLSGLTLVSYLVFVPLKDLLNIFVYQEASRVFWVVPVLLLNSVLFAGSLYQEAQFYRFKNIKDSLVNGFFDLQKGKAIYIAPFLEEIYYRALFTNILLGGSSSLQNNPEYSPSSLIFVSAAVFSVSHAHPVFAKVFGLSDMPPLTTILVTLFQMLFTFVFGLYAGTIYIKTGSWVAAFALHSMCNLLGVPRIHEEAEQFRNSKVIALALYFFGVLSFFWILFHFFL